MTKYIFAYGSLMWKPGFEYTARHDHATLQGFHREFNVKSVERWGSKEKPGATLGLEKGGECIGIIYEVQEEHFTKVMEYLRDREGAGFDFPEVEINITIKGEPITLQAVTAMYKSTHEGYLGHLDIKERATLIRHASGSAGTSSEYVASTRERLIELKIDDPYVEEFYEEVKKLT